MEHPHVSNNMTVLRVADTKRPSGNRLSCFSARDPLGGSWVVISGDISPLIWVMTIVTLRMTPLITTHEPPSRTAGDQSQ